MPERLVRPLASRVTLLICALIAAVLGLFLWTAFNEVQRALIVAAGQRMQSASGQIATLLSQSTLQRLEQLRRVGQSQELQALLAAPTDDTRAAAERVLAPLTAAPGQQSIEVWDVGGTRVLLLAKPGANGRMLPADDLPVARGVGPMRVAPDGTLYSVTAVDAAGGRGALVVRRLIQITPPDLFTRLTGGQSRVLFGNVSDGVWTDLTRAVPRPDIDTGQPGIHETRDAIGAIAPLAGTPWAIWSELPRSLVLAPAYAFLRRMAVIGVVFVALAVVVVQAWSAALARARRQAQQDLDQFFSVSLDLLCIANMDGRFTRLNPAWQELFGWTPQELYAAPYVDFIHPDDREATIAEAGRLAEGIPTVAFENRYRCKDGSYKWLSWKAAKGGPDTIYAAARDVTERKRASAELQQHAEAVSVARAEAERANEAKNIFLSHMSHDLRTPLNSILGFAQLLDAGNLDEERRDYVRQILSGGRHLLDLISEVLDIARIDSGQLSLSPEPVGVREVVDRVVSLVKPIASSARVKIVIDPSVEESVAVIADRQRFNQIVLNFLSNAVKYNIEGGLVTIAVERLPANRTRISVTDTGQGIPESKLALLFQPFERLGAEQTAVEGTGLGLALSRALAEAMGGSVGVKTAMQKGSTFWLELESAELPAIPDAPPPDAESTAGAATARRATIVYVEDNASNVRLMRGIIKQRPGLELLHAATAEQGLSMIRHRHPELVLLDLHLPDMPGDEIVRRLRADPATKAIPIVIATADASPGVRKRMLAAGATESLSKPLDIQRVLQLFDELV